MNQVNPFLINSCYGFALGYLSIYSTLCGTMVMGYIQDKAIMDSHHVIFDNLGKLSTGITYINVAIPLNISILSQQLSLFENFLDNIVGNHSNKTTPKTKHEHIQADNMYTLTKAITSYARNRLWDLIFQLDSINKLLPNDGTFDKRNLRHKRFMGIGWALCAAKRSNDEIQYEKLTNKLQQDLNKTYDELDQYKEEYARLYQDTLPEVIPQYIDDHEDIQNRFTLLKDAKNVERQIRDVQFLINIIKTKDNNGTLPTTTSPANTTPTTPHPFKHFENIFGRKLNHKRRGSNSFYMQPDPKFTTTLAPLNQTREKRFVVAAALTAGILGTFFGLYNTIEINRIQDDLRNVQSNQKLLIEYTKTMEKQIMETQVGLSHLENIFSSFIKNNPALLYAKFNDQLLTIQDRIGDLKDTLQMLQLQKLSTSLLSANQLLDLYNEIQAVASVNSLSLLTNQPQDLFQIDTSYIRVNDEILILLHVPCASPSNLLTIYKYVPFPIPVYPTSNISNTDNTIRNLFDSNQNSPNIANEGITFTPEADLIAIGKNNLNKNRFILLSSAELQACTKRSNAFICERHQVTCSKSSLELYSSL